MKTLLLLGGSEQQIVAIEEAKNRGYKTVLCDYLLDNPGQRHADAFYPVSTTDKNAVLDIAVREHVDGVLAYASDPAAPTAAYVAECLGLPGNPLESVEVLCNKDKYRAFLLSNGFNSPEARFYKSLAPANVDLETGVLSLPVLVKPSDSSGSKGISLVREPFELPAAFEAALLRSRAGVVVVEEFVEKSGYQIAGDGLSINGQLSFTCFGNDHFDRDGANPFVPVAASFPSIFPERVLLKVREEIQRLITLLGMKTCLYNFDIRIGKDEKVYLMEVAPRSGGNYIPQIIKHATGVDLVACAVKAAMGEPVEANGRGFTNGYWAYYAVHSKVGGVLDSVNLKLSPGFSIVENHLISQKGDQVSRFVGSNATLGCLVMSFDSSTRMLDMLDNPDSWLQVKLGEVDQ